MGFFFWLTLSFCENLLSPMKKVVVFYILIFFKILYFFCLNKREVIQIVDANSKLKALCRKIKMWQSYNFCGIVKY